MGHDLQDHFSSDRNDASRNWIASPKVIPWVAANALSSRCCSVVMRMLTVLFGIVSLQGYAKLARDMLTFKAVDVFFLLKTEIALELLQRAAEGGFLNVIALSFRKLLFPLGKITLFHLLSPLPCRSGAVGGLVLSQRPRRSTGQFAQTIIQGVTFIANHIATFFVHAYFRRLLVMAAINNGCRFTTKFAGARFRWLTTLGAFFFHFLLLFVWVFSIFNYIVYHDYGLVNKIMHKKLKKEVKSWTHDNPGNVPHAGR
jgi:hypothetical protein